MYGFSTRVKGGFDAAIAQVTEELQKEGFGVLSDIDVASKLNDKVGAGMRPYRILGACNPPLAHKALGIDYDIGLLLPCNVVVREEGDGGISVGFMDPMAVLSIVKKPGIEELAKEVRGRLERVRDAIAA